MAVPGPLRWSPTNSWHEYVLEKRGETNSPHRHVYHHDTIVVLGGVRVEVEGQPTRECWAGDQPISIAPGLVHRFTALVDNTKYFCIFGIGKELYEKVAASGGEKA
jgi:quercetin dioxygenase-like cupin family protein